MSPVSKKRNNPKKKNPHKAGGKAIRFVCLQCEIEEDIPQKVLRYFDIMDGGDSSVPPRFSCKACGGEMRPANYKGVHGQTYTLEEQPN